LFVFLYCKNINLVLKYLIFFEILQKQIYEKTKKKVLFSCIQPSLSKYKKYLMSYFHTKKNVLACILRFNNQLIKAMRTGPIFQKYQTIFCFLLVSKITNLYVRCIPNIKMVVLLYIDIRTVRFLPDKKIISLLRRIFLKL
jgi:hypothetical protein